MTANECNTSETHARAVAEAKERMPDENLVYDLSDMFKVLSDSTRLKILWSMDGGEICVCGIAEVVGMSVSATSHQLRMLKQMKLVKSRRKGKNIYYSLDDSHVNTVLKVAMEHLTE
ncbi:MAG: metalloregulator ArsR/SmtB family transcription factor [Candidatus Methanoplasma sp.]|jgi:ArsR family transcriptional regulator|nr:metalloregulator ArsR/SmtB family transcription factor [Candidatus Methanoplasma sp.]